MLCKSGGCGLTAEDNSFQLSLRRGMCVAELPFMSVVKTGCNLPGDSPLLLFHKVVYITRKAVCVDRESTLALEFAAVSAFVIPRRIHSVIHVSTLSCCKYTGIK